MEEELEIVKRKISLLKKLEEIQKQDPSLDFGLNIVTKSEEELRLEEEREELEKEERKKEARIQLLDKTCKDISSPNPKKLECFNELYVIHELTALDVLATWQSSLAFVKNQTLTSYLDLLKKVVIGTNITSIQKMEITTFLYNRGHSVLSFELFKFLAKSKTIETVYRIEACKYLYASINEDIVKEALEIVIEILKDSSIPSEKRYDFIRCFNSSKIRTIENSEKLIVPRNIDFIYKILYTFFANEIENKVINNQVVLAAQALLQLNHPKVESKSSFIMTCLMNIAKDSSLKEGFRATAADVIVRLGKVGERKEALLILSDMGTMGKKSCSIYDNSQNVHTSTISQSVIESIENLVDEISIGKASVDDVVLEIKGELDKTSLSPENKGDVRECINRILRDEAVFTRFKITSAQCLLYVWLKIKSDKELKERLWQELLEIPDDCPTGYPSRIINVLPGAVKISYKDQILSNMLGRLFAIIRSTNTEETENLGQEEYKQLLSKHLMQIKVQLAEEFKVYISEEEFEEIFNVHYKNILEEWS